MEDHEYAYRRLHRQVLFRRATARMEKSSDSSTRATQVARYRPSKKTAEAVFACGLQEPGMEHHRKYDPKMEQCF